MTCRGAHSREVVREARGGPAGGMDGGPGAVNGWPIWVQAALRSGLRTSCHTPSTLMRSGTSQP